MTEIALHCNVTPMLLFDTFDLATSKVDLAAWRRLIFDNGVIGNPRDYKRDLIIGRVIYRGCWPEEPKDGRVIIVFDRADPLP